MTSFGPFVGAHVSIVLLNHCGERIDKASYDWIVNSAVPLQGGADDRNLQDENNASLQVRTTHDFIQVADASLEEREKNVQVFDAAGRLVINEHSAAQNMEVPVGQLGAGLWVMRVTAGDQVITRWFSHF